MISVERKLCVVYYITKGAFRSGYLVVLAAQLAFQIIDMPLFDHARNFIIRDSVFNDIQVDPGVHRYLEINVALISILKATIERLKEILEGVL